jgi:hypothetical protein
VKVKLIDERIFGDVSVHIIRITDFVERNITSYVPLPLTSPKQRYNPRLSRFHGQRNKSITHQMSEELDFEDVGEE